MVKATINISFGFSIGIILSVAMVFNSCTYEKGGEPSPVDQCDSVQYTYTGNIEAIFQVNCATSGCHDAQTGQGGVKLTTYQEVKSKVDAGRISARMLDGNPSFMPPPPDGSGKLPDSTLAKVQKWIDEGACE